jgi:hypothetical protein
MHYPLIYQSLSGLPIHDLLCDLILFKQVIVFPSYIVKFFLGVSLLPPFFMNEL